MSRFVRPRPVPLLFFIGALITTVGLGTWQVKRLQWKEALIAEIETARTQQPLEMMPFKNAELKAKDFYPVKLEGVWVENTEFHVTPRWFKGQLGYFVVSPFIECDGRKLLINRGWVPADRKDPATRPETAVSGAATIHGIIRVSNERNWMTPPNDPKRNLWFGRDVKEMAASANIENPILAMVDIVGPQDVKQLPVPSDGQIRLRNDHLSYILTWYGIALGVVVIFVVYHRKPR